MRTIHILTLAIVMSLTTTPVFAKGQDRPGADRRHCQNHLQGNVEKLKTNFETLDTNHDGVLTVKESGLKHAARMCFRRLDRDHDRRLSTGELAVR